MGWEKEAHPLMLEAVGVAVRSPSRPTHSHWTDVKDASRPSGERRAQRTVTN